MGLSVLQSNPSGHFCSASATRYWMRPGPGKRGIIDVFALPLIVGRISTSRDPNHQVVQRNTSSLFLAYSCPNWHFSLFPHKTLSLIMCKYTLYTEKYKTCKVGHIGTIRTIIQECSDPMKGFYCPNATEDKTAIFGSVSKGGPCPQCPSEVRSTQVQDPIFC